MPLKFINKYFNLTKNETYFVISFFIFIGSLLAFIFYGPNYNGTSKPIDFVVKEGSAFNTIINDLYDKRIISSKYNIKIAAFLFGVDKNIKAGRYKIPDGINYISLLTLLNEGRPKEQKLVTIQEGIWQKDLAELLEKELGIEHQKILDLSESKDFIESINLDVNNLEGYLLPETYYFYEESSAEEVLKKLSNEQSKLFDKPEIQSQMKIINMDRDKILTMASIIDGESNLVSEFKRIAGVYYNRLKKGWRLQADPTVQYLVRQRRKQVNRIYYKDLEIDSKYNTYKYYGLPPSPINNPGKDAIMAALYPEEHDLFYFVADGNGGHKFSKSSNEHQRNVARYRVWRENNK
ncbi:MAG: endolytic transglycosylase MltG [Ignavibacteriales bacterium]|nr:endolytic transglycosylase MltG [Ignavibacteriales bacterium]MCB9219309.1 endolytic transglycosylase MltG [Ignavibacteriales bacterium]MCB9260196.1 endolytic transglycosylase MltG [Ignavibacteriales bacterium]